MIPATVSRPPCRWPAGWPRGRRSPSSGKAPEIPHMVDRQLCRRYPRQALLSVGKAREVKSGKRALAGSALPFPQIAAIARLRGKGGGDQGKGANRVHQKTEGAGEVRGKHQQSVAIRDQKGNGIERPAFGILRQYKRPKGGARFQRAGTQPAEAPRLWAISFPSPRQPQTLPRDRRPKASTLEACAPSGSPVAVAEFQIFDGRFHFEKGVSRSILGLLMRASSLVTQSS